MPMPALTFAAALLLSSAFLLARYCRRFTPKHKHRWRALSAGVAVAYVFVNVIPELEEHRPTVTGTAMSIVLSAEKRIYVWSLGGFIAFAGLRSLEYYKPEDGHRSQRAALVYWGVMAGYALYTLLLGYLLIHREEDSLVSLELFVFAMGLHIFMLDHELVEKFEQRYAPRGGYVLAFCVLLGWVLGSVHALSDSLTSRLFAFIVGGVVMSAAHEELPSDGNGRFWWFVTGATFYATLLMLI
jgi:hypothetical protein